MERQSQVKQAPQRVTDADILLLELWDVCLENGVLADWKNEPEFGTALRAAFKLLHAGNAVRRCKAPLPHEITGFEAVFLTGGGIETGIKRALAGFDHPILIGDGVFAAAPGGFELLKKHRLSGWVADWGQSQLKIIAPEARWIFRRDFSRLRMSGGVSSAQVPGQRRLREFLALALGTAMAELGQRPAALVLALASRVHSDGTLGGNTYAGFGKDCSLLPDAMQMAGLDEVPLLVLSDAELAAHSARCDPRLAPFRKVLVITLGYGIGAALVHRGLSNIKTKS